MAEEANTHLTCFLKEDNETMDEFVERIFQQFPEIKKKQWSLKISKF